MTDVRDGGDADVDALARPGVRDVFVSYSRGDIDRARDLVARLERTGRTVWVDWSGIPPTAEWMSEVRTGIDSSQGVVFLLSSRSLASEVCGRELEHAEQSGKRIVPVALEDLDAAAAPDAIARRNWIFARDHDDLDLAVAQIIEGLDVDLDKVREHTRILVRAREWEESGQDSSRLLRGADLAAAETWLADTGEGPRPTPVQAAYVVASRAQATKRQRRLVTAVALVAVASLLLAGFAAVQRSNAATESDRAQTQAASAVAITQLGTDPEVSLLLALEAARTGRTAQSDDALRRALSASHVEHVLRPEQRSSKATPMVALTYTDDGTRLVTGGNDGAVRVWDAGSGALVGTVDGLPESRMLARAPGTSLVVSFDQNGSAQVVDAASATKGASVTLPAPAASVEVGRSAGTVVLALLDGSVHELDARTGVLGAAVTTLPGGAYDATYSPDGSTLAVAGADGALHLIRTGSAPVLVRHGTGSPYLAHWSGDSTRIVSGWTDSSVTVVDAVTGSVTATLPHDASPTDAEWVGARGLVITGDSAGVVRAWDPVSARVVSEYRGHTDYVPYVAVSPSGDQLASTSYDNTARLWSLGSGVPVTGVTTPKPVVGSALLPDGRTAVVSRSDGTVEVVDLTSATPGRVLDDGASGVPAVSADGRLAAVVAVTPLPEVRVIDVATGTVVSRITDVGDRADYQTGGTLPARVTAAAFDPSGTRVALATSTSVRVAEVASGKVTASLPLASDLNIAAIDIEKNGMLARRSVAWTPDGALVAVTAGPGARLWDPSSGKVVRWFEGHAATAQGLAIDRAGRRMVTASVDKTARVWDLTTGALLAVLRGHTAEVLTADFSPSGDHVVTSGLDGTVRVWEAGGTQLLSLPVATVVASSAHFLGSEDRLLVTAEEGVNFTADPVPAVQSGSVSVYDCEACRPRDELLALGQERVTRSLTEEERAVLLGDGSSPASAPSPTASVVSSPLVGTWTSDEVVGASGPNATRTVELRPTGSVVAFDLFGFGEGTFSVDGSSLTLDGLVLDCPAGDGRYAWAQQGDRITLTPTTARSDQCQPTVLRPLGS